MVTSYNLKGMTKTMLFIRQNQIDTREQLQTMTHGKLADYNEPDAKLKSLDSRLSEIAVLKKHILNYRKTKDVYVVKVKQIFTI